MDPITNIPKRIAALFTAKPAQPETDEEAFKGWLAKRLQAEGIDVPKPVEGIYFYTPGVNDMLEDLNIQIVSDPTPDIDQLEPELDIA